jgi:hypothetical protein
MSISRLQLTSPRGCRSHSGRAESPVVRCCAAMGPGSSSAVEPAFDGWTCMPIKSKAQRRKFAELLVKGEISPETFEEWNRAAGSTQLPERLHPKVVAKPKRKAKSKRVAKAKSRQSKTSGRPARRRV